MAKISDLPPVVKSMGFVPFVKRVVAEVGEDDVFTWASALAYTWVFSIFPLLLAIVTLAPYLPGQTKESAVTELKQTLVQSGVGGQTLDSVATSISDVLTKPRGGLLIVSLFVAIFGASGGMATTMTALDKAYEVKVPRPWWKQRLVAVGITLATIVLVLLVIVLLPVGGKLIDYFKTHGSIGMALVVVLNVARYLIAVGLLLGILSIVYYFGPNIRQKWHAVSPGALIAITIWILAGIGFGIYLDKFGNFNATYGALGAAIALLLFLYISAMVLLVGAEINSVIDFATLGVEPGTQDFTQAVVEAKQEGRLNADGRPAGSPPEQAAAAAATGKRPMAETAAKPAAPGHAAGPQFVPIPSAAQAQAGWWKWALAAVAAGMVVGAGKKKPAVPV